MVFRRQTDTAPDARADDILARLTILDQDPYLCIADPTHRLISVFDDLRYDRADMDMLSGPMRTRALTRLKPLGFRQISGGVVEHKAADLRLHLPKFRALGASPFHATHDTPRRAQDFYVLTPTQTACLLVDLYDTEEAVARIKTLIVKHPANLLRLFDFLEKTPRHEAFAKAIGHLKLIQREAVEAEPLKTRRALR